jgi:hypothetical protein
MFGVDHWLTTTAQFSLASFVAYITLNLIENLKKYVIYFKK